MSWGTDSTAPTGAAIDPGDDRDLVFSCRDLEFSYLDRFVALDGVSLDVHAGERLALIGANGCGKSTLLKVLDGLVVPSAGSFHAFGEEVTEDTLEDEQFAMAFRSRVGFVFQNSDAQLFSPSVREEVAFGCLQMGMGAEEATSRVADVLSMLEIEHLAERAPFQLSGGQKKSVALATVLVMNPDVLLFDEPTAALDPRTQHWLVSLMRDLGESGKTIINTSHDLDLLPRLADRCVVFGENHRIIGEGTPADVLADTALMLEANLMHQHLHRHGPDEAPHSHPHAVGGDGHHHR